MSRKTGLRRSDNLLSNIYIALWQPISITFLPKGQVGLHSLISPPLLVLQPILFQH